MSANGQNLTYKRLVSLVKFSFREKSEEPLSQWNEPLIYALWSIRVHSREFVVRNSPKELNWTRVTLMNEINGIDNIQIVSRHKEPVLSRSSMLIL
jgi:hypothetical protein